MDNNNIKTPSRISVSRTVRKIIDDIDVKQCLNLEAPFPRIELFVFAMSQAIGAVKMPLEENQIEAGVSLVRDESIDIKSKALIYAYYIADKLTSDNIDSVSQKTDVYLNAQICANTGFYIINDYIKNHKPSELKWELVKQMDELYSANVKPYIVS